MLRMKYSLTERFVSSFKDFGADRALMEDLFVNILGITPTCTWQNLVAELRAWKPSGQRDFDSIQKLYECLSNVNVVSQMTKLSRNAASTRSCHLDWHSGL